ncbi:MAG: glycoside hydrolase family 13 protein [Christensenellales bacterium]|jgi:cyclomaltodextrinase|nr:glycoside hydrolase family 13 protein [Clostridiales bacterium]
MKVIYNSRDLNFKKPFGAVKTGQKVFIKLKLQTMKEVTGVSLFLRSDSYKNKFSLTPLKNKEYSLEFSVDDPEIYYYRFEVYTHNKTYYVGHNGQGIAIVGEWLPEWQLTVYDKNFATPEWLKGGLIYHIFPDRFARVSDGIKVEKENAIIRSWYQELSIQDAEGKYFANDFYGGNIKGVISKLEYLRDLGVSAIYFSPIFKSSSNHRYDTGDYFEIDPLFGTEEEFKLLLKEAKKLGIEIILDGVFNHTGADSVYFNKFGNYNSVGAYQSTFSEYYDWYTFYNYPNDYHCWWGVTVCPTISRNAKGFQDMIAGPGGVIEKWSLMGVKGWRLDVVDEISDAFVEKIRERSKKHGDVVVIGEVWEDASTKISYDEKRKYLLGKELDGVMNYPYKEAIIDLLKTGDMQSFINQVYTIAENYPKEALDCSMTLLGTHDTVRIINVLSGVIPPATKKERLAYRLSDIDYERGRKLLRVASLIQYFLPGVATVYYGDEVGVEGFEDPINRRPFPKTGGDKILLAHYQSLGKMRKQYREKFKGKFKINIENDILVIDREGLKAMVNLSQETIRIKPQEDILSKKVVSKLNRYDFIVVDSLML